MKIQNFSQLDEYRARLVNALDPNQKTVTICGGTGCRAYGSEQVLDAARANLKDGEAHVRMTGCHGFCEKGPLVVVQPEGLFYSHVQPKDMPEIVDTTIKQGKVVERLSVRSSDRRKNRARARYSVLRAADALAPESKWTSRSDKHRRIHHARRLCGLGKSVEDDRRSNHR